MRRLRISHPEIHPRSQLVDRYYNLEWPEGLKYVEINRQNSDFIPNNCPKFDNILVEEATYHNGENNDYLHTPNHYRSLSIQICACPVWGRVDGWSLVLVWAEFWGWSHWLDQWLWFKEIIFELCSKNLLNCPNILASRANILVEEATNHYEHERSQWLSHQRKRLRWMMFNGMTWSTLFTE